MAYTQIRQLGFNERVGNVSFAIDEDQSFASTPYSKQLKRYQSYHIPVGLSVNLTNYFSKGHRLTCSVFR